MGTNKTNRKNSEFKKRKWIQSNTKSFKAQIDST